MIGFSRLTLLRDYYFITQAIFSFNFYPGEGTPIPFSGSEMERIKKDESTTKREEDKNGKKTKGQDSRMTQNRNEFANAVERKRQGKEG